MSYGWRDFGDRRLHELCDECGFDSRQSQFEADLFAGLDELRNLAQDTRAASRPAPETWSAVEYVEHCLETLGEAIAVIETGRPDPKPDIVDVNDGKVRLRSLLDRGALTDLHRSIDVGGPFPATPAWMLAHLLHEVEHHSLDIRRGYAQLDLRRVEGRTVER